MKKIFNLQISEKAQESLIVTAIMAAIVTLCVVL